MRDFTNEFRFNLDGKDRAGWMAEVEEVADRFGDYDALGDGFHALRIDAGRDLIVTFETVAQIRKLNHANAPMGWNMAKTCGWSSLTLLSEANESWFRSPEIYKFFDQMIDDGDFDGYDRVLFFGAGGGGYAAGAYSVAAPEARVLMLRPQATLDPAVTRWDRRFPDQRRADFTSRFGYAPFMLETAEKAWVIHDPTVTEDAMHAFLLEAENTQILSTRRLGPQIERDFAMMGMMDDLLDEAMEGTLDAARFGALYRARRDHLTYLRGLYHRLDAEERNGLLERLCRFTVKGGKRPMFAQRLNELQAARQENEPA